jgi:glutamine amidotransferase
MHNGFIGDFSRVKRDLTMAIDASLYPEIAGQADTEVLFYLALTFGLKDDLPQAVARAIGLVEEVGLTKGVRYPFQGTIATTDGERTWAFRYSSEGKSRSLFFTTNVPTVRQLYPDLPILEELSDTTRLIVSEPIGTAPGAWQGVPESSYGVVGDGDDQLRPFEVKPPTKSVAIGV